MNLLNIIAGQAIKTPTVSTKPVAKGQRLVSRGSELAFGLGDAGRTPTSLSLRCHDCGRVVKHLAVRRTWLRPERSPDCS